jgi:peptide/nickel transport system substrate-binding protein
VKRLVFKPIPDDAVRVAALQNGEIDIAVNIPPHLAAIIANHPRLFLSTAPSVRTIQLLYYTHQFDARHKLGGPYAGPVADRRVRLAMNHAVDVDEVIRSVLDGKGIRVATMLTDRHFGFDPKLNPIKQDLARTRQLLSEAGFPNGLAMVLNAPQGRLRARQGGGGGHRGAAHQGGDPDDAADPRVGKLPQQHGVRP